MERINQYSFYEIGQTFNKLQTADRDVAATSIMMVVFSARRKIDELLGGDPLALGVSRARAHQLSTALHSFFDKHFMATAEDGTRQFNFPESDVMIPSWETNSLNHAVSAFEAVFREEMREAATYLVPSRGIYDTAKLVDSADQAFPLILQSHIPEKAREEWKGAGRCLAFGLLSASGFHVARAVEAMLETYCDAFGIKNLPKIKPWGVYVAALEKLATATPCPDERTVSAIRQMKDDWRNPLMHPRVVLTEAEARMLFSIGESLIIAMANEVAKVAAEGLQPQLALAPTEGLPDAS